MLHNTSTDSEWLTKEHVFDYLNRSENIPHRAEGEAVLLENIPANTKKRVLDLGTGNGRLLNLLNKHIPNIIEIVGVDVSPIMIKAAKERTPKKKNYKICFWAIR